MHIESALVVLASLANLSGVAAAAVAATGAAKNNTTGAPGTPLPAFKADIRADANRDGVVDVKGTSDKNYGSSGAASKWTEEYGALFLANIGDSKDECKALAKSPRGWRQGLEGWAKCNGARDEVLRAAKYLSPMRTVAIPGLSDSAKGTVRVVAGEKNGDDKAQSLVRIFVAKSSEANKDKEESWQFVNKDHVFSAEQLRHGLELGIDARDVRRPGPDGWDGRVRVEFAVRDGDTESKDSVELRVAPVLTHHHLQPVRKVMVSEDPVFGGKEFVAEVESNVQKAGLDRRRTVWKLPTDLPFVQDGLEAGYMSRPGPDGSVVSLTVLVVGSSRMSNVVITKLRGDDVAAVMPSPREKDLSDNDDETVDDLKAGGNTETLPPYSLAGGNNNKNNGSFPLGRVLLGGNEAVDLHVPRQMAFFRAQEAQPPLLLDSTWLSVGHVDEIVQVVARPGSPRGWAVIVLDPQKGVDLLRDLRGQGRGDAPITSYEKLQRYVPTVSQLLDAEDRMRVINISIQAMQYNVAKLQSETGLADDEIFRLPAIIGTERHVEEATYRSQRAEDEANLRALLEKEKLKKSQGLEKREEKPTPLPPAPAAPAASAAAPAASAAAPAAPAASAAAPAAPAPPAAAPATAAKPHPWAKRSFMSWLPNMVNGVPLSDSYYMAPHPFGPLDKSGKDVFEEAARKVFTQVGFKTVSFVKAWDVHQAKGELHCATNTLRDDSKPWWAAVSAKDKKNDVKG